MSVTYSSYLKLDELLELQQPLSEGHIGPDSSDPDSSGPEHDEMLFIVIHQVYELWFKQTLHEMDRICRLFDRSNSQRDFTPDILLALRRVLTILKTMVSQIDVLETMTPMDFLSFRDRLESASGFQSPQFRELEFLLGHRVRKMLAFHHDNPKALARLERRLNEPTLYQAFLGYLRRNHYDDVPEKVLELPCDTPPESEEIRNTLIKIYRNVDHRLIQVCERLVDLDEGLQEWRYRHVKMVERTIGNKKGTGGSAGTDYLRGTLFHSIFPDLWNIRAEL